MGLSDLKEVTPSTSSDDIREYAEQVFKEVEADRKGEPDRKSDAQIISEQAGLPQPSAKPKETLAEKQSGNTTALDGEDTGIDDTESPEWLTDDVKAEATAYGIDVSELTDFASREEFEKALRFLDKTALQAGRKALENGDAQARNDKGQFVKKDEPKTEPTEKEGKGDGKYQVSLDPDIYDGEIISELTRFRDHIDSRLGVLEAYMTQVNAVAEEQRFDSEIDKLDMPKLFGSTGKETAEELKRREDVLAQARVLQAGYQSFGKDVAIETLVARAATMVFSSEFEKQKLKQRTSKISRQSQLRQGGSPTKPIPPRDDPREEADRLYRELAGL